MNKCEIIERLKNIAGYAVHTVGEEPFVMSLDDGIAVREAIELLEKPETNCSEIPNSSDTISRQQAIDEIHEDADWLASQGSDWQAERMERDKSILKSLPSIQPEQQWIPVTEIPPRGRDLMLKIHDACNSFFYYHMGFHDGEKYFTYNFFWEKDKDLEIVGWRLCPWEAGEQE